jgi:mono/diheme cytochrome c family protein
VRKQRIGSGPPVAFPIVHVARRRYLVGADDRAIHDEPGGAKCAASRSGDKPVLGEVHDIANIHLAQILVSDDGPVGMFDDTPDGNGSPVVNSPLFRQDLAAPFGSAGEQPNVENFANQVYTLALDPTSLATPEGRKFLTAVGGKSGTQLSDDYAKVLRATNVTGYPFGTATTGYKVGDPASPVGRRVDEQKLADLRAYLEELPAPAGARVDPAVAARGRQVFVTNCASCHNADQSKPVQRTLIEMNRIWPGYHPTVLAPRSPPLDPIQNATGTFDDKMIVVDASLGGGRRGNAIPMLFDLASKPMFLHDGSVHSMDDLLNPHRGAASPHPFYVADPRQRADVVQFLRGLDIEGGAGR